MRLTFGSLQTQAPRARAPAFLKATASKPLQKTHTCPRMHAGRQASPLAVRTFADGFTGFLELLWAQSDCPPLCHRKQGRDLNGVRGAINLIAMFVH